MQIALTSPIPGRYQVDLQAALVRGHEAAIRLVDARGNYVCLCCPAPLLNNGMFKTGPEFHNVLCHIYGKQHTACATRWVKVKYLMRCLRLLFARVAGCSQDVFCFGMLAPPNASMLQLCSGRPWLQRNPGGLPGTREHLCECMSDRSVSCGRVEWHTGR